MGTQTKKYIIVGEKVCGACVHYCRHYSLGREGHYWPLDYGHCVYPRNKKRLPDQTCVHWSPKAAPETCGDEE